MPDYSKGKIYKLVSNKTENIYIGSTTQPLCDRKSRHNTNYKLHKCGKYGYLTSFELMQYDDVDIVLLENVACESKDQLHARERHWIESTECVNKRIPTRSKKEYLKKYNSMEVAKQKRRQYYHETKNSERYQQYRINNKEKKKERNRQYYQKNIEKAKQYQIDNADRIRERQKQHRLANLQEMRERDKQYKIAYAEKNKEKISCECGSDFRRDGKSTHLKTKKHLEFLKEHLAPQDQ
jgi:hypothetical protein